MKKKLKNLLGILVGLGIFITTLYLSLLFYKFEDEGQSHESHELIEWVDEGIKLKSEDHFPLGPASKLRIKKMLGKDIIYDDIYSVDENLMRIPMKQNKKAKAHIIFAGCSFIFGQGLITEKSLPWIFNEKIQDIQAYNLSFLGGGLNMLLAYFENFKMQKIIKQDDGIFVYSFMIDHFSRFFGNTNYFLWGSENVAFFGLENDKIVRKGKLKDQFSFKKHTIAKAIGLEKSMLHFEDRLNWNNEKTLHFTQAVKELKSRYLKEFPKGKFYLLIHPVFGGEFSKELASFKEMLQTEKIAVLDPYQDIVKMAKMNNSSPPDLTIKGDGHPTADLNQYLSDWLARELKRGTGNQI